MGHRVLGARIWEGLIWAARFSVFLIWEGLILEVRLDFAGVGFGVGFGFVGRVLV